MAYEDMFSVGQVPGVDEEDYGVPGVAPMGAPDLNAEMFQVHRDLATASSKHDQMRQQQMARAMQTLQQRQVGPTLSERLLQLSAAFAQPSRTRGFAGVLGNVAPVLAEQSAAMRQGEQGKTDALLALQQRYQDQQMGGEERSLAQRLALLKAQIAANKPSKPRIMPDGIGGFVRVADDGSLSRADVGSVTPELPQIGEVRDGYQFKGGDPADQNSWKPVGKGGGGGNATGGFRNIPSGNPLVRP